MALFERATTYANKAKVDKTLSGELRSDAEKLVAAIEGRQFMAHANSILHSESVAKDGKGDSRAATPDENTALIDRLETYYEDPKLMKGNCTLTNAQLRRTRMYIYGKLRAHL
jgi:hypothetical protein